MRKRELCSGSGRCTACGLRLRSVTAKSAGRENCRGVRLPSTLWPKTSVLTRNRVRDHVEQRRQRLAAKRSREIQDLIFKQAAAHPNEIHQLRTEKRLLLENERQMKAFRDVERHNARTAQILQERRQQQQQQRDRQKQQERKVLPQAIHLGYTGQDWRIGTT